MKKTMAGYSSSFSSMKDLLKDPSSPKPKSIHGFPPKNDAVSDSDSDVDVYSLEGNVSDTSPSLSDDDLVLNSNYNGAAGGGGVPVVVGRTLAATTKLPPPPITCLKRVKEGKRCVFACADKRAAGGATVEAVTIPQGDLLCANRGSGNLKLYFNWENNGNRSDQ